VTVVPQSRSFDVLGLDLDGVVAIPEDPVGLVLFLRGPGGSDDDERDLRVANELHTVRIATVCMNLLTAAEQRIDAASTSSSGSPAGRSHRPSAGATTCPGRRTSRNWR
jgi:putative phosphoribosyl transferase